MPRPGHAAAAGGGLRGRVEAGSTMEAPEADGTDEGDGLDVEAAEATLQAELEQDLRELEALDRRLRHLSGANDAGAATAAASAAAAPCEHEDRLDVDDPACTAIWAWRPPDSNCQGLSLEDLPFEPICVYLQAAPFATLQRASRGLAAALRALLELLEERRRASGCPGPPLLLSLLRFSHSVQAPCFALCGEAGRRCSAAQPQPRLKVGYALEVLPPAEVDPDGQMEWCPLRLRGKRSTAPLRHSLAGASTGWNTCVCKLPRLVTPRVVQTRLVVEPPLGPPEDVPQHQGPRFRIALVDSASPLQPLFALCLGGGGPLAGSHTSRMLSASVREVVSCRGGPAGAWMYRQCAWPLGVRPPGEAGAGGNAPAVAPPVVQDDQWLCLHFEFDWEASLCAALVDGRIEGPLDVSSRRRMQTSVGWVDSTEFSGAEPTVDEVHIDVAPGICVAFAELLVG